MCIEYSNQFLGLGIPDWGDVLLALSLIGAVIAWYIERHKERVIKIKETELREKEIQWKRTEFIFEQATLFDGDNDISDAVQIITGNNTNISTNDLLDPSSAMSPQDRGNGRHKLDKLLNLMDRVGYSFKYGVLTKRELSHFEWYYLKAYKDKDLKEYCQDYYPSIIFVAKALDAKDN